MAGHAFYDAKYSNASGATIVLANSVEDAFVLTGNIFQSLGGAANVELKTRAGVKVENPVIGMKDYAPGNFHLNALRTKTGERIVIMLPETYVLFAAERGRHAFKAESGDALLKVQLRDFFYEAFEANAVRMSSSSSSLLTALTSLNGILIGTQDPSLNTLMGGTPGDSSTMMGPSKDVPNSASGVSPEGRNFSSLLTILDYTKKLEKRQPESTRLLSRKSSDAQTDLFGLLDGDVKPAVNYAKKTPAKARRSKSAFKKQAAKDVPALEGNDAALGELFAFATENRLSNEGDERTIPNRGNENERVQQSDRGVGQGAERGESVDGGQADGTASAPEGGAERRGGSSESGPGQPGRSRSNDDGVRGRGRSSGDVEGADGSGEGQVRGTDGEGGRRGGGTSPLGDAGPDATRTTPLGFALLPGSENNGHDITSI